MSLAYNLHNPLGGQRANVFQTEPKITSETPGTGGFPAHSSMLYSVISVSFFTQLFPVYTFFFPSWLWDKTSIDSMESTARVSPK